MMGFIPIYMILSRHHPLKHGMNPTSQGSCADSSGASLCKLAGICFFYEIARTFCQAMKVAFMFYKRCLFSITRSCRERFSINVWEFPISWERQRFWCSDLDGIRARSCSPTGPYQPRPSPTFPAPGLLRAAAAMGLPTLQNQGLIFYVARFIFYKTRLIFCKQD